ncbi:MAG TPA: tetratricopeptide repeat protein [Methylomirabilota bacterium]
MNESLTWLARGWRLLEEFLGSPPDIAGEDPETAALLRRADDARRAGRRDEAAALYRDVLRRRRGDVAALRGLRDALVETRQWREALAIQQRLLAVVSPAERARENEALAVVHYEGGRAALVDGRVATAIAEFKNAVRADRHFVPAAVALGDAHEAAGDHREAVRVWERAAETHPVLPLLARLERSYRDEGRPTRMIALYRSAVERAPDDLSLAAALGRVYFELEMLDEAADQFEKVEVRAPDLPVVHAFLGAVFERRGDVRDAFDEYRRSLRLGHGFDWPHRCTACGAEAVMWQDRCPSCRRFNTLKPAAS